MPDVSNLLSNHEPVFSVPIPLSLPWNCIGLLRDSPVQHSLSVNLEKVHWTEIFGIEQLCKYLWLWKVDWKFGILNISPKRIVKISSILLAMKECALNAGCVKSSRLLLLCHSWCKICSLWVVFVTLEIIFSNIILKISNRWSPPSTTPPNEKCQPIIKGERGES